MLFHESVPSVAFILYYEIMSKYPVISQYTESHLPHNGINVHLPLAILDLTEPGHDLC